MRPMNRKLLRDLWHLRGQVLAVALVIASGVAVLSMSLSTTESLSETAAALVEAAAIDLLGTGALTNKVRGLHSRSFGRVTAE